MSTAEKLSAEQIKQQLPLFTGTTRWYKYSIMGISFHFTDGVHFLAESAGAWWMIDLVASYQVHSKVKKQPFQVYEFVRDGEGMKVTISDGNDNILATQDIEYTDFPLDEITIWYTNKTALLPSEY